MIQEEQLLLSFTQECNSISPNLKPTLCLRDYFVEEKINDDYLMLKEDDFTLPKPQEKDQLRKKRKVTDLSIFSDCLDNGSPIPHTKFVNLPDCSRVSDFCSSKFKPDWIDYPYKIPIDSFGADDATGSTRRSSYCTSNTTFPFVDRSVNMGSTNETLPYISSPSMSKEFDWNEDDDKNFLCWKQSSPFTEYTDLPTSAAESFHQHNYASPQETCYEDNANMSYYNKRQDSNSSKKDGLLSLKRLGNPINKVLKIIKENNVDPNVYKDELLSLVKTGDTNQEKEKVKEESTKKLLFKSKKESYSSAMRKASKKNCCSCKQSHCLKLYCECFKVGDYCSDCTCPNCLNRTNFEDLRQQSINHLKMKNKNAFKPVVSKDQDKEKHIKGCKCKNSNCKKNYCECYQNGIGCSSGCKCTNCLNGKESDQ